jgi:hypothetical protein
VNKGCTRARWTATIDAHIQAVVGVACFTRSTELIAQGNLRKHGIYYCLSGIISSLPAHSEPF